jgi:hypothetical protein
MFKVLLGTNPAEAERVFAYISQVFSSQANIKCLKGESVNQSITAGIANVAPIISLESNSYFIQRLGLTLRSSQDKTSVTISGKPLEDYKGQGVCNLVINSPGGPLTRSLNFNLDLASSASATSPGASAGPVASPNFKEDSPMFKVTLSADPSQAEKIFSYLVKSFDHKLIIKGKKGLPLKQGLALGIVKVAQIISYEPNNFFSKKLGLSINNTSDKLSVIISGTPLEIYQGQGTCILQIRAPEKILFQAITINLQITGQ